MVDVCGFHVGKYTVRPMAWYGRYRTFTLPPCQDAYRLAHPAVVKTSLRLLEEGEEGFMGMVFLVGNPLEKRHLFSCPGALNH